MRATVVKRIGFDAAHYLPNYVGKCSNIHGHHWVVELGVTGEVPPETGMVIDFSLLKTFLEKKVIERYDHRLLNDFIDNPTAENIASRMSSSWALWNQEKKLGVELAFVRVWETEDSYAEVTF